LLIKLCVDRGDDGSQWASVPGCGVDVADHRNHGGVRQRSNRGGACMTRLGN
jgi:hypothetical protein